MGVLDDAIREHLDLKRRRGASEEEIARAEAEALTPARRPPPVNDLPEDEHGANGAQDHHDEEPQRVVIEPVDDVAPPPEPTRAVHDIDEDPMPSPALGRESVVDQETVEADALDIPSPDEPGRDPGRLSE